MTETIGRYEIREICRVEPLGRLLKVRLPETGREFYLKELCPLGAPESSREQLGRMFEEEARALCRVADARIPQPLDYQRTPTGAFLLFDRPEAAGFVPLPLNPSAAAPAGWLLLAVQFCEAAAKLQEAGILLFQFQPASMFVNRAGELRYLHFGFAHLQPALGLPVSLSGPDPSFTAPELAAGQTPTAAALVFSVGAWLYASLSGLPPLSVHVAAAAGKSPDPLWTLNPGVPARVDDVIQTALHPDPARRYPGIQALGEALQHASSRTQMASTQPASGGAEPAREPRTPAPEPQPAPAWEYAAWMVGLGLAGGAAGTVLARILP